MSTYTVQIEASDDDQIWYALHESEIGEAETARAAAEWTAQNQNIVDDDANWRILVWEGTDTSADPTYVHYATATA